MSTVFAADQRSAIPAPPATMMPIVLAGSIGTIIEWYDFLIYGTAAALVFNSQFFPTLNPLNGTLGQGATSTVPVPVNSLSPQSASSVCRFQFSNFNDLVNEEDHYQLYGEVNYDFSDNLRFHGEVAWNRNNTPNQRISPANGNTQFPTPTSLGGLSGSTATPGALNFFVRYNLPGNNPGLRDATGQTPGSSCVFSAAVCASVIAAGPLGVDMSQTNFRFIANAGAPFGLRGADVQQIEATAYRVSGGLSGNMWHDIHWDTNLTYMKTEARNNISDLLVDRVQNALNGFGSKKGAADQCTIAERANPANAGNAAVGCYFFNPMSNAIAVSATNGQPNPFYRGAANPLVINDPNVVSNLYGNYTNIATSEIFAAEAVLSGKAPITLPGGQVQWALGTQYRYNRDVVLYGDFFNNKVNPCVDSIDDGTPVCGAPSGPLIFFGSGANSDDSQDVFAAFGEARLPLLDTLEATLAVRYEKFSSGLSTTRRRASRRVQNASRCTLGGVGMNSSFGTPG